MKFIAVLISAFLLSMCGSEQRSSAQGQKGVYENVSAQKFQQAIDSGGYIVLDVRTPEECETGMIRSARNMNFYAPGFEQQLDKLDKSQPVLLYCASGGRSGKVMDMMKERGFVKVYNLDGGFSAWEDSQK